MVIFPAATPTTDKELDIILNPALTDVNKASLVLRTVEDKELYTDAVAKVQSEALGTVLATTSEVPPLAK